MTEDNGNDFDVVIPEGLPKPLFWKVLIAPVRPPKVTKGGIIMAAHSMDLAENLQFLGRVAAIGDLAWKRKEFAGAYVPVVGDLVIFSRHSPMRIDFGTLKLVCVYDQDIHATVDPATVDKYKVYV